MWLYKVMVTGEEVTVALSKQGKDFMFLAALNSVMMTNWAYCVNS
jgi:hypothetical protein